MKARSFLVIVAMAVCASATHRCLGNTFEIIVSESLGASPEVSAAIDLYVSDIVAQGYDPILTVRDFSSPEALRSHLAGRYQNENLAGAVLVGDVVPAYFERADDFGDGYARFASDLYYQDLDGLWADWDTNGTLDLHTGDVAPEIFVGRISTSSLTGLHEGRTEESMVVDYFRKNHAYRTKQLSVAPNGLAYTDDDWATSYWGAGLSNAVEGTVTSVLSNTTTTAADYAQRLANNEYEAVVVTVHSNETVHVFYDGLDETGRISSAELRDINPQALFYNLFACSAGDFTTDDYLAGEYIFGTDMGLLAVATTKTGGMKNDPDFWTWLGEGDTFGEAMDKWWNKKAMHGFSTFETDWYYGMVLLGDPLLTMQPFRIPEPATVLLLCGAAALAGLKRRR